MDIKTIIDELMNIGISKKIVETKPLSGGTTSKLYLLSDSENNKYVVKFNEPHVLEVESHFLAFYKDVAFLPDLLYTEPAYRYIVYSFVAGAVDYPKKNKKEMLQTLVEHLINHYRIVVEPAGWGWADELTDSWQSFLLSRANESSAILNTHLEKEDHEFILELIKSWNRNREFKQPYLLHGDCGIHNFIFTEEKLTGVIDPTPVYGEPLYDLIYAFCSSPDDLAKETIQSAASLLKAYQNKNDRFLHEEVLMGLYFRMASCVRHHPEDLEEYLKAWEYWKNIVKATSLKK
ncbi:aminoglycoside phosphotransferase family protein [Fictibacillus halophilus]|uniref:aminoglycoside phosphotransferase family protein n=1 Tax=Fictibacillus halophilus TaxID=1610490 RepID=UPI001CFA07CA|nr:aminoglycoside phosphotransferase family protein [Fictibacillus halophilus]